jgi:hypothetical protein
MPQNFDGDIYNVPFHYHYYCCVTHQRRQGKKYIFISFTPIMCLSPSIMSAMLRFCPFYLFVP